MFLLSIFDKISLKTWLQVTGDFEPEQEPISKKFSLPLLFSSEISYQSPLSVSYYLTAGGLAAVAACHVQMWIVIYFR